MDANERKPARDENEARSPVDLDDPDSEINRITKRIIGCAYRVANTLGTGFLEKVYENALAHELRKAGLKVAQQASVRVHYDGVIVGDYTTDLLVEDAVLVELKVVKELGEIHRAQCLNYLRATGLNLCLLLNFAQPKVDVMRVALTKGAGGGPHGRRSTPNVTRVTPSRKG